MQAKQDRLPRALGWFSIGLGAAEVIAPGMIARIVGARDNRKLIRAFGARELAAGVGLLATTWTTAWLWARVAGDAADLVALGRTFAANRKHRGKAATAIASVAGVTALDVYGASRCRTA